MAVPAGVGAPRARSGQDLADRADPRQEPGAGAILRQLLKAYDDVVYRAAPGAATVVTRVGTDVRGGGAAVVHVRLYPPPTLAEVA
jgi:hypothetical protein